MPDTVCLPSAAHTHCAYTQGAVAAAAAAALLFRRQAGVRNAGNFPEVVEQVSPRALSCNSIPVWLAHLAFAHALVYGLNASMLCVPHSGNQYTGVVCRSSSLRWC
jgi:hypothetical protein